MSAVAAYPAIRPMAHPKRVKLVSTCDNCKNRKVKCDKERPECGTCKRTGRACSYTFSAISIAIRENGVRARGDWEFLQSQLDDLQNTQFNRVDQMQDFLLMANRSPELQQHQQQQQQQQQHHHHHHHHHEHQQMQAAAQQQAQLFAEMSAAPQDFGNYRELDAPDMLPYSINQTLATEMLQQSTEIATKIERNYEQCQYDPGYWLNPAEFATLAQQVPELPTQVSPPPQQDTMNQMIQSFNDLNFQSTRYIGEGSLLLLGDDDNNEEKFIPNNEQKLSNIDEGLKVLPDPRTVDELIWLYYEVRDGI